MSTGGTVVGASVAMGDSVVGGVGGTTSGVKDLEIEFNSVVVSSELGDSDDVSVTLRECVGYEREVALQFG